MSKGSFYFKGEPYVSVMRDMYAALCLRESFLTLTGKPNTGKSRLCEKLSQYMQRKGFTVVYFDYAIESPEMLRESLAEELGLKSSVNLGSQLEKQLSGDADNALVLIFDDAHLLTDMTLLDIYRLAETQINGQRLMNIALVGEPFLENKLLDKQQFNSLVLQRSHNFKLSPMDSQSCSQFICTVFAMAGRAGLQLESGVIPQFYAVCKGYPGVASYLCKLILGARKGRKIPHPVTRLEFIKLLAQDPAAQSLAPDQYIQGKQWKVLAPMLLVLGVIVIGLLAKLVV